MLVDVLGNDIDRARERVRPDAHHQRGRKPGARNRDHPVRQGQVHAERRLQRQRLLHLHRHRQRHDQRRQTSSRTPPPSPSPSPRSTTPRRPVADSASVAEDGNALVDVLANDSTGPGQRVRPDADDHAVGTPGARHRGHPVRQGHLHAGRRLQRPRLSFTYTVHRQRHDQRRRRSARSDTGTVDVTVTEVNDAPTAVADSKTDRRGRHALLPGERPDRQRLGRPCERGQPDPDRHLRRPDHGRDQWHRLARRRHGHLHAGCRLQRPRKVQLHRAGQRHDQRSSGLQDRNRLRPGHRHRGERRAYLG